MQETANSEQPTVKSLPLSTIHCLGRWRDDLREEAMAEVWLELHWIWHNQVTTGVGVFGFADGGDR